VKCKPRIDMLRFELRFGLGLGVSVRMRLRFGT
jgi:hypothetical protein